MEKQIPHLRNFVENLNIFAKSCLKYRNNYFYHNIEILLYCRMNLEIGGRMFHLEEISPPE